MFSSFFSSSSSSTTPQEKYDVFISFRGTDTRDNFTAHLYAALCRRKIKTFIDDEELRRGDEIAPSLLTAIQESKVSVIVFSKEYACSRWCLEELVKIIECKNTKGHIVIPVFYGIDPCDVRHQSGTFADAFVRHKKINKRSTDELHTWKGALTEAANLSGFDSTVIRCEAVLVEEVVNHVLKRLNDMSSSGNEDRKDLVGVDSRIEEIELKLCRGSIGIWGPGGIGKTTLAEVVFNRICNQFEVSRFIQNVSIRSEKGGGLIDMRQKLLSTILEDENVDVSTPYTRLAFTKKRLGRKKVFIVFDDVTNFTQIESLIEGLPVFDSESRFIITTRNKQVLKNCGVDEIYKVEVLHNGNAFQLFSRYAFKQDFPAFSFMELSNKIVTYAKGLPLALKVLGSSLMGKNKQFWEDTLKKLERSPNMAIQKVLEISFDGLDDDEKNIFLDISCFFRWNHSTDSVMTFLDSCGFFAEKGLSSLVDKSLIIISSCNKIQMHDLIQEMGREIVRRESIKDPGARSRLWHHDDIYDVLTENTGTAAIEGISLDMSKIREIDLNPRAFSKMKRLRFFHFYSWCKMNFCQDFDLVSTKLRYFHWFGYPMKFLPSNFYPKNLVELHLPNSNVKQLWNGIQDLVNIKLIDLSHSEHLTELPNLSRAINLQSLNLEGCTSLLGIPSSIQYLSRLEYLFLMECKSLSSLPTIIHLKSLSELCLEGCSNIKFPNISVCIERLYLHGTAIEELPSSIQYWSRLNYMDLSNCKNLRSLSSSIGGLKSLRELILSDCSKLERLPDELGNLEALQILNADGTAIKEVPSSIIYLKNLETLSFEGCKGLILPPLSGLCGLSILNLTNCGMEELPDHLCKLSSLENLLLDGNYFKSLPASIINLSKLTCLSSSYCSNLQSLPKLPIHGSSKPLHFDFTDCFKLDQDAIRDITKDVLLKIQLLPTLWLNNHIKNYDVGVAYMCFPGNEIPEWFSFQTAGSFISSLHLPPILDDRILLGFVVCTVVTYVPDSDHNDPSFIQPRLKFFYGPSTRDPIDYDYSNPKYVLGVLPSFVSDHICMGYYIFKFMHMYEKTSFNFYVDTCGFKKPHYQVKKCGVHLIYIHVDKFLEKPLRNRLCSFEDETVPLRKRLRLL